MKIFTKQSITFGLCLTLILVFFLSPVLAAKPDNPGGGKGDGKNPPPSAPTLVEQIEAELDYIVNSSWVEENKNSSGWKFFDPQDDIYGTINSNRIPKQGAPGRFGWVQPGNSAMAAVGFLQGLTYLYNQGENISKYDSAIAKFFLDWQLRLAQGQNNDSKSLDYGAFADRVNYDNQGKLASNETWKTDVTAQIMIANWKYYEYLVNTNQTGKSNIWIKSAWGIQKKAADYLVRMFETTPAGLINLLPGNSSEAEYTAWIHFAANSVPALRGASRWARKVNAPFADYDRVANSLVTGIKSMKDTDKFFKFRPYLGNNQYGPPEYGDSYDQLLFVPYETGALAIDDFTNTISDWFTNGNGQAQMTYPTNDSSDWRYYGTLWHYWFDGRIENQYLYPGPGFQLAKVEWKISESTYTQRSLNRLNWGKEINYSSLWWFLTGEEEAGVPNGYQDWRDSQNYPSESEDWARFVDTSAYFIEALLMNEANLDTNYNPVLF